MDPLILNTILYISVIIWYWHKYHKTSAVMFILIIYAIFAINAFLLWNYGEYKWLPYQKNEITNWPYLYTFGGYIIFLMPILRKSMQNNMKIIPLNTQKANLLYYFFLIELLLGAFLNYSKATSVSDFTDVYAADTDITPGIAGQFRIISTAVYIPALTLVGYYCSKEMLNKKRALILLAAYFFNCIIESMTCGSRGVLFFTVVNVLILLFIFKEDIDKQLKRYILYCVIIVTVLASSIAIAISVDRFGDDAWNWIFSYFGEPFLNISTYYWDAPFVTGGALTFAPFTNISYNNHHYMMILFKLFSGQAMLDFGKTGGIIFITIISLFLIKILPSNKNITFNKAIILVYTYYHCMFGIFGIRVYGWSAYALLIALYFYTKPQSKKRL